MTEPKQPEGYKSSVPDSALEEALKSVERLEQARKAGDAGEAGEAVAEAPAGEVPLEVETAPAAPEPAAPAPQKKGPQDAIIEALIKGKQEAQEALKQTQKEAKDLLEARARIQAEFENFKKRVQKEKQETIQFAAQNVVRELLPIMDNFERALVHVDASKLPDDARTVITGINMVQKQMSEVLRKLGVVSFTSKGEAFDPNKHEAVSQVPATGDVKPGSVVEEHQKGYLYHDRLLRPALVVVAGPRE
ncbi:MAG: nucleotide exchange factor GrpE [Myxococcota bacterium]